MKRIILTMEKNCWSIQWTISWYLVLFVIEIELLTHLLLKDSNWKLSQERLNGLLRFFHRLMNHWHRSLNEPLTPVHRIIILRWNGKNVPMCKQLFNWNWDCIFCRSIWKYFHRVIPYSLLSSVFMKFYGNDDEYKYNRIVMRIQLIFEAVKNS